MEKFKLEEKSYVEQKNKVLQDFNELIKSMDIYLEVGVKRGGTLGHKIGSTRNKLIQLKKFTEDYC